MLWMQLPSLVSDVAYIHDFLDGLIVSWDAIWQAVLSNQWMELMKTNKLLFHLCICALRSFDNRVGFARCIPLHQQELYERDYLLGTGRSGSNELWSEWSFGLADWQAFAAYGSMLCLYWISFGFGFSSKIFNAHIIPHLWMSGKSTVGLQDGLPDLEIGHLT